MCVRYERGHLERVAKLFAAELAEGFNAGPLTIHPKDPGIVVRVAEGRRVVEQMTWGFPLVLTSMRTWAKERGKEAKPKPVNNARFDKLGTPFWERWVKNPRYRCLIPTTRYAEAVGKSGQMTETWLSVKDQPVFAWAGLWRPTDEWGDCYTGVMTDNAPELAYIHDRSPVIVEPQDWEHWLSAPMSELNRYDQAYPATRIEVEHTNEPWAKPKVEHRNQSN